MSRHPAQGEIDGSAFFEGEILSWPEATLQAKIIELAAGTNARPSPLGWAAYHTHDSRHSAAGWPDLVLVRERLLMAELKREKGQLSARQVYWIELLRGAGVELYVWRPSCWISGEIEEVLTRRKD